MNIFKPQNTPPVPSTRSVTSGRPGGIPNEISKAKNAIKLYPGVPGQAEQLHLESFKPSMSMPTRDTLPLNKKVKKALNVKVYKFFINLILNCKFLRPAWFHRSKFKFWPQV